MDVYHDVMKWRPAWEASSQGKSATPSLLTHSAVHVRTWPKHKAKRAAVESAVVGVSQVEGGAPCLFTLLCYITHSRLILELSHTPLIVPNSKIHFQTSRTSDLPSRDKSERKTSSRFQDLNTSWGPVEMFFCPRFTWCKHLHPLIPNPVASGPLCIWNNLVFMYTCSWYLLKLQSLTSCIWGSCASPLGGEKKSQVVSSSCHKSLRCSLK